MAQEGSNMTPSVTLMQTNKEEGVEVTWVKGMEKEEKTPQTSVFFNPKKRIISAFVLTIGPVTSCLVIFSDSNMEQA